MVVGFATDVLVILGDDGRRFFGLDLVELGVENVLDALVGDYASWQSAATGGFQALLAVRLGQPQETEAGAISLLRMLARFEERLDDLGSVGADRQSPVDESLRCPLQVFLVRGRHMLGERRVSSRRVDARMGRDAVVVETDLDGGLSGADVDLLL